jgi:hypothetical protein
MRMVKRLKYFVYIAIPLCNPHWKKAWFLSFLLISNMDDNSWKIVLLAMFYGLWTGYLWVKYQHFPRKLEQVKKFVSLWNYADKQGTTYILRRKVRKFHEEFEGYMRPEQNVRFQRFSQVLLYSIIRRCTMKWTWIMEQLIGKISMRNFSVLWSRYSLYYCEVCKWHSYY